jgi:histidinol-phosphate aminotransferase
VKARAVLERIQPYVPGERIPGGIKLASNENPFGPSPFAVEAITGVLDDLHFYPDGGMTRLRAALAHRWDVSPDMVIVGNGSDEILVMIAGAVIEPGTNAITAVHTFSQYTFTAQIFGADVRAAPMREGRFDLDAMADRIDDQTRIVYLCSPNNPTGTIIASGELSAFLERIPSHVLVVVDEAYGEYVTSPDYPDTIAMIEGGANLIRLRTFSKIYGLAALRVGYGIARSDIIGAVSRLRQPFNVGTIGQVAAAAALEDE